MNKWNTVTPLSRFLAVVLFVGIVPVLSFYIGVQYEKTVDVISRIPTPAVSSANTTGSMATWKTFTSTSLGFSIRHPLAVTVTEFAGDPHPENFAPAHVIFSDAATGDTVMTLETGEFEYIPTIVTATATTTLGTSTFVAYGGYESPAQAGDMTSYFQQYSLAGVVGKPWIFITDVFRSGVYSKNMSADEFHAHVLLVEKMLTTFSLIASPGQLKH